MVEEGANADDGRENCSLLNLVYIRVLERGSGLLFLLVVGRIGEGEEGEDRLFSKREGILYDSKTSLYAYQRFFFLPFFVSCVARPWLFVVLMLELK